MARYAIIGLGTFGSNVARSLFDKKHEVIAIDVHEDLVQRARDFVNQAVTADATDRETLEALGLQDVDYAVLSVGDKIDASILITLHLTEMGVRNIVVKAVNETHGKILTKIGATEIVFPEKQMAMRVADRIGHKQVLDQIQLSDHIAILEIRVPPGMAGVALRDSKLRPRYHLNVVAVKQSIPDSPEHDVILPRPDYVLGSDDILMVIGRDEHIEEFKALDR